MTVYVDLATIEQWKSGSITGRIALRFGELWFPEADWSDFPVVILEWWLSALGGSGEVLRFMDGPFSLVVDRAASSAQLKSGDVLVANVDVDSEELQRAVRRVARSVVKRCDELGLTSADVEALRRRIASSKTMRA